LHHAISKPDEQVSYHANRNDREELEKEEKANQARRIKEMNL